MLFKSTSPSSTEKICRKAIQGNKSESLERVQEMKVKGDKGKHGT